MNQKTYAQAMVDTYEQWKDFVLGVAEQLTAAKIVTKSIESDSSMAIVKHDGEEFQLRRAIREASDTPPGVYLFTDKYDLVISVKGRRMRRVVLTDNGREQKGKIASMIADWYTK